MSSRLMVIATVLTTLLLLNGNARYRTIRTSQLLLIGAVLFSLLSVFNYTRNYGFYEERDLGFWGGGFAEIITYLGCSSQAALGTAARTSDLVSGTELTYRDLVDIEIELNAPSAFVILHEHMGYLCWAYIAAVCTTAGLIFSMLVAKGRTVYLLPCGVILYAASDLWRVDLFGQGIFITLLVIGIGVPGVLSFISDFPVPRSLRVSKI